MARGAIAAGHELTARAGAAALEAGGTAVDAVVAAGAMSWAAEPALTGPCGGGFVMVRPARGRAALLDAFTAIPGRDLPPGPAAGRGRAGAGAVRPADDAGVPCRVSGLRGAGSGGGAARGAPQVRAAGVGRAGAAGGRDGGARRAHERRAEGGIRRDPGDPDQHAGGLGDLRPGRPLREGGRRDRAERAGRHDRAAGRRGARRAVPRRTGAGDRRPPAPARWTPHDGRSGVIPAGMAEAAAVGVQRARADHERAAVVRRRPDRLHAGGAGAVRAGARRGAGGFATGAGGVDASGRTSARRPLRAAAAQGRAGGAPAVARAGAGGAA